MTYTLNLNGLIPKFPIIQGGMGVGISLHQLAGHVAAAGGIGIISSAQVGYREKDFLTHNLIANKRALYNEIIKAKEIAPQGIIGVNIMVALKHYKEMVETAIHAGADLIISGAGLPINLPQFAQHAASKVKLVPVVSSGKAATIICKMWDRKSQVIPDGLVVEGPLAGGHLGFSLDDLNKNINVIDLVKEVQEAIRPFEEKYQRSVPVIAAGGIYSGEDVKVALENGCDGVQMATRFVTTYECDAPLAYKETYLKVQKDEIDLIKSPVGMPGRAIMNAFIQSPPGNKACYYHCLEKCGITTIPYCISNALIAAANGDVNKALLFCGANAYKAKRLEHVSDIFNEIKISLS
ncbi:MAG: nitronate monooxygenase [Cellulosilyticum sp.]|nr:nitronate monooxygenase [Cellulosilyticum sp.]